jgi:hypothetical protein
VLLAVLTEDEQWLGWSSDTLARCADASLLAIDPVIDAEVSLRFARIEDLDQALPARDSERLPRSAGCASSRGTRDAIASPSRGSR